jgi:hypothetical protein
MRAKTLFELLVLGAGGDPARAQHLRDGLDLGLAHAGARKGEKGEFHGAGFAQEGERRGAGGGGKSRMAGAGVVHTVPKGAVG